MGEGGWFNGWEARKLTYLNIYVKVHASVPIPSEVFVPTCNEACIQQKQPREGTNIFTRGDSNDSVGEGAIER
eukprot:3333349-Amphidinium_carterae.1